jgi:hypothetical protein
MERNGIAAVAAAHAIKLKLRLKFDIVPPSDDQ